MVQSARPRARGAKRWELTYQRGGDDTSNSSLAFRSPLTALTAPLLPPCYGRRAWTCWLVGGLKAGGGAA